jgi:hypothetical protein
MHERLADHSNWDQTCAALRSLPHRPKTGTERTRSLAHVQRFGNALADRTDEQAACAVALRDARCASLVACSWSVREAAEARAEYERDHANFSLAALREKQQRKAQYAWRHAAERDALSGSSEHGGMEVSGRYRDDLLSSIAQRSADANYVPSSASARGKLGVSSVPGEFDPL